MISSLFARRFAFARPLVARRTLSATVQLGSPPAKTSTRKTTEKKTATESTTAKKDKNQKQPAKREEKQRVRIPKDLKPPKRAPTPYLLFYSSYFKSQPQVITVQSAQEHSKRAAEIWRGYTIAEKQPFYDEWETRKAQCDQEREEFFRNTPRSELRKLNAIRKAQGKKKYRVTDKSIPQTPFILFSNEFRTSPEAQALINEIAPEKRYQIRVVLAAASRWRSMSEEEKAPYSERYKKAKAELAAEA